MINYYHLLKKKHAFVLLLFLLAAVLILSGCNAEAAPKVYRVGILSGVDAFASIGDGFIAKMTELGYKEGKNITYDFQKVNADPAKDQEVLNKFVTDKVDLIFAFPTEPALIAKATAESASIPVIFALATIEGNDLVENIREPGGNITGVRFPLPELMAKRLEILLEIAPQTKRVLLLHNPDYPPSVSALESLKPAASTFGVELVVVPITSVDDIVADLQARDTTDDIGVDAILIMPEIVAQSPAGWKVVSDFAAKHKLPISAGAAFELEQGAVFLYNPESIEMGALVAPLAEKILKGTPAGTIPVLTPEARLTINYKLAQELGLTVPEGLLSQADKIIR